MGKIGGFATQRVTLKDGISTRYIDSGGDNPTVILIHGLAASIEAWRDVVGPLSQKFRVLAFDLPGFGHSDKPAEASYEAVTFFVPMLKAFMDALDLSKAHMVGSSMGASLIVRFSARYPDMLDRAVLANPGGFGSYIHPFLRAPTIPIVGGIMSRPMRATNAFALTLTIHNKARRPKTLLDEVDAFSKMPGAHRAFVRTLKGITSIFGLKDMDIFETEARSMSAPTLIIWGDKDKVFPVRQSQIAASFLPAANLVVMPNVGHFPQIDDPAPFAKHVAAHLSG
jgi:pimeloyl-ACP methyl ester carboxylesterase